LVRVHGGTGRCLRRSGWRNAKWADPAAFQQRGQGASAQRNWRGLSATSGTRFRDQLQGDQPQEPLQILVAGDGSVSVAIKGIEQLARRRVPGRAMTPPLDDER
jgi:hypothetical protein